MRTAGWPAGHARGADRPSRGHHVPLRRVILDGAPGRAAGRVSWVGWIAFASLILFMLGTFHVIDGIVALTKNDYYLVTSSHLAINVSYTTWGWVHILGGILVFAAGAGVLAGQVWARVVGTAVAVVSAVVNIVFLAAYPIWSLMMIGLAVVVIMALTVHGSEIKAGE